MVALSMKKSINQILRELRKKDSARESMLKWSREAVKLSSQAIALIHRRRFSEARKKLERVRRYLDRAEEAVKDWPELLNSGSLITAYQEYVEAQALHSTLLNQPIPGVEELSVPPAAYLLGLADFIGELRREVLEHIKNGELSEAQKLLGLMEEVYTELIKVDVSDALTPGLRRKCDVARKLIETTAGDVALEVRRQNLENAIRNLELSLGGAKEA